MSDREALVERLMHESEEFRQLRGEHQRYEQEISELQGRHYLSADQEWRVSELKKRKLMTKDRMEALIRQAGQTSSSRA
ncbi:MAG: YdcH family protein [Candidatus Rokubacteria bacterium]|nr:YdcH family protein [Candidatus Rokubacteria bacterium]